ncbi:MAG: hypothetical protein DME19_13975 [Verrucomicrobia bacterium]|nr:MAG: hypothetical protein DME19_13975 [Verrucomicrobiota bacterium]
MSSESIFPVALLGVLLPAFAYAQPTQLMIERNSGPARLGIIGEVGLDYTLEASTGDISSNTWQPLVTARLTDSPLMWFDSASAHLPQRFYRAVKLTEPASPVVARDFRLIDHLGRSRHLDYHLSDTRIRSIVLVFTGNECGKVREMIPAIKSLRDLFASQGVLFWMIDSDAADDRSNIVAGAAAQGIDLPVLHDAAQLVAREYGAGDAPEAFVLKRVSDPWATNWAVIDRGAIDDRMGPSATNTTQYYLSDALTALLANQPVAVSRTRAEGCAITFNPALMISYSTNVAPLLQAKCVQCHSPGNIAPWAMTNYDMVQSYAGLIKDNVLNGEMPPWHADPFYSSFANDFSLTPREAAMLVQWINDGAPRGGGPDPLAVTPPPPTNYPFAWPASLGQPDLVLSILQQNIPATGVVGYRYLNVTTTFPTDTWIRAAVIRPGNRKVVHHSLVFFGSDAILRGLSGFFAGCVPGYDPVAFPEGTAKFLPKGTVLQFQMHYITTGQAETDQTEIGLYVSPAPPTYALQTKSAPNTVFSIPPGSPETVATASYTFNTNVRLYEMSPHMHLRGAWFGYEAVYPDSTREVLLSVPHYEFHWQTLYRLAQPSKIPIPRPPSVSGNKPSTKCSSAISIMPKCRSCDSCRSARMIFRLSSL